MADNYVDLPVEGGGGGGGAVSSVNGATGAIDILGSSNIDVTTFGTNITINAIGTANTFAGFNASGDLEAIPGFTQDTTTGGMVESLILEPNNAAQSFSVNNININFEPLQNSPDETYNLNVIGTRLDNNSSGFSQGTTGSAVTLQQYDITHLGTGDVGSLTMMSSNFNLGNGVDPIDVKGVAYSFGFGSVNSGVTLSGPIQGYGFQPNVQAGSTLNSSVTAFYDFTNVNVTSSQGHTSFISSPSLATIPFTTNYTGFQSSPNITNLEGFGQGVGVYPTIALIDTTANFQSINTNPTVTLNKGNAIGVNVDMTNVTNDPGVKASLVVQDITYQANTPGTDGNNITVEYTNTVLAGNEVATLAGTDITVSIESGVSTATQVAAALAANFTISSNLLITISGTASNPQVTYAQTSLAGGVNPGTKKAAYFGGDVQIDGALSFSGALSIGALNSFAAADISGYPPGVNSIDSLVTQPSVPANTTLSTDLLAINTAMLINVGDNSTLTSSFLGYTALGLPAVANIGVNSSVDLVCGAAFAISLDSSAGAGSSIAEVDLCRSLAIPNGITTVGKLVGYKMDLPFGDPGTTTFGLYITPTAHNYMAGDLVIGGTPSSDDTPSNASVALEIKSTVKAFLPSRMTTTERDALTAINGMVLYNTTTDKLQVYAAGSWVDLH